MEQYGKILLIVMPVFFSLILLEKWFGWYKAKEQVLQMDMISSLSSAMSMITKNVLGLSITIISYGWIESKIALTHIHLTWLTYVIAFVVLATSLTMET